MPRRPTFPWQGEDKQLSEALDHYRQGTHEVYESAWTQIRHGSPTIKAEFLHELGEVPMMVSVLVSDESDGRSPRDATSDMTVTFGDASATRSTETTTLTVENTSGGDLYFKVRAM
jgi:hypothetical protein